MTFSAHDPLTDPGAGRRSHRAASRRRRRTVLAVAAVAALTGGTVLAVTLQDRTSGSTVTLDVADPAGSTTTAWETLPGSAASVAGSPTTPTTTPGTATPKATGSTPTARKSAARTSTGAAARRRTTSTGPSTTASGSGSSAASGSGTRFTTVPPGGTLPSGAKCAALVRGVATPAEVKGDNRDENATTGAPISGATGLQARVDGNFTGTTEQILRWAACKWGIDEDHVKAQAAIESWWHMDTRGDWGTDASRCAPGHGIGADGTAGQCPESFGLLQIRYPYNQQAFPYAVTSSAFNADYAYAQWRACYTGEWTWLNTVERGRDYAAGDSWGCMGVWFSGRWYTSDATGYISRVKGYLDQRIWTTTDFREP